MWEEKKEARGRKKSKIGSNATLEKSGRNCTIQDTGVGGGRGGAVGGLEREDAILKKADLSSKTVWEVWRMRTYCFGRPWIFFSHVDLFVILCRTMYGVSTR